MSIKPWKTIKTEVILENQYVRFKVDDFQTMEGVKGRYWYLEKPTDAVTVVAQLSTDQFVLVHEYRYVCRRVSLGHIAGNVEPGETPEIAAERELHEEIGYLPGRLISLGGQYSLPAFCTEYCHVYLAQDLKPVDRHPDVYEQIEPVVLTPAQIDEAIRAGEMVDGIAIAAWYRVKHFLRLCELRNSRSHGVS